MRKTDTAEKWYNFMDSIWNEEEKLNGQNISQIQWKKHQTSVDCTVKRKTIKSMRLNADFNPNIWFYFHFNISRPINKKTFIEVNN